MHVYLDLKHSVILHELLELALSYHGSYMGLLSSRYALQARLSMSLGIVEGSGGLNADLQHRHTLRVLSEALESSLLNPMHVT